MKQLLEFTCAVPKIGAGKHKNQLTLINNAPLWLRWYKPKIVKAFKESLDWSVPKSNLNLEKISITFNLYRPTARKLDSDGPSFVYKWIIDYLNERGYMKDDDQVTYTVNPVVIEKNRVETEIKVQVYECT